MYICKHPGECFISEQQQWYTKKGSEDTHLLMQRGAVKDKPNIIKNQGFFSHYYKSIVETNKNVTCPSKYISLYAQHSS